MDDDKSKGQEIELSWNGQRIDGKVFWAQRTLVDALKGLPRSNEPIPGVVDDEATLKFKSVKDRAISIDAQIPTDLGVFVQTLAKALDAARAESGGGVSLPG